MRRGSQGGVVEAAVTEAGCIAYLRVSKRDGRQTTLNQRPEVEALAAARGRAITEVYEDRESAVRRRPGFERMLKALRQGRCGPSPMLVIWSLDRLGRGLSCFDTFRELTRLNVRVVSCREPWLDVDGPARELLVAVMAWVSGFERQRLVERTMAGLDRARRQGRKLGRPSIYLDAQEARALREQGLSFRAIAARLGCGSSTVHRALGGRSEKGHELGATAPLGETRPQ